MPDTLHSETAGLNAEPGDDLSALAWVHGELRRSLEAAHKSLRRYLRDAESGTGGDLDVADLSTLRSARTQIHQGVGALELVGLPAAAEVLRASESAVQRLMSKPALVNSAAVETIERASFALLDFLTRQLARKPVSPLMLFPQYRATLGLAGADRVHPADLWKIDWQWMDLPSDLSAQASPADDAARSAMETQVLALMRDPGPASLQRMSELCAGLAAGAREQSGTHLSTLWQLAAAQFEAQAVGLLDADIYTKRMASRLLAQLRGHARGNAEPSDRLAQDLLFFCAQSRAPASQTQAPRLRAVRAAWRLGDAPAVDYETVRLGRFDPAHLALARKRVTAAKDAWSAVAGGEMHRLAGLGDQFSLVGESLNRLFPSGEVLAQVLQVTVSKTVDSAQPPAAPLAMEVATGILYLEACLEDGELDQPELGSRVQSLAARIEALRQGGEPQPLDGWMEDLYRRVSDRQTMGSVVQELRASLSEVEKQIDQYFRNPGDRHLLIPVPAQLSAMRGVLSVLGMDQASQAALHMRDDVDALAQTEVDPQRAIQAGTFDRLADNLGALSFLIDMLSVQPQLAKSLFRFDPVSGSLSAVMGQSERVSAFAQLDAHVETMLIDEPPPLEAQIAALGAAAGHDQVSNETLAREAERLAQRALAADQPDLARVLNTAHDALLDSLDEEDGREARDGLVSSLAELAPLPPEAPPAPAPVPAPRPAPPGGTGLEDDEEMREIFIEEAREVIGDAGQAVQRLLEAPDGTQDMTIVRRAFHTLKGSSRMVGLRSFGDAAWSCEQLFNARLAQAPHMDEVLREFTADALAYLGGWVDAIEGRRDDGHLADAVSHAADALRLDDKRVPLLAPASAKGSAAAPTSVDDSTTQALRRPDKAASDETTQIMPRRAPESDGQTTIAWPAAAATQGDAATTIRLPAPAPVDPLVDAALEADAQELAQADDATPDVAEAHLSEHSAAAKATAQEPETAAEEEPEEAPEQAQSAEQLAEDMSLDAATEPESEALTEAPQTGQDDESAAPVPEIELDFELSLPDLDDPIELPPSRQMPLIQRMPDLPSAADLDLTLPGLPQSPPAAQEADFELDLGDFNEPREPSDRQRPQVTSTALPDAELPSDQQATELLPLSPIEDFDIGGVSTELLPLPQASEIAPGTEVVDFEFDLGPGGSDEADGAVATPDLAIDAAPSAAQPELTRTEALAETVTDDDQVKVIGSLRIGIPLFNIYLNEADELSRRLVIDLAEWSVESERHPVSGSAVALAHSLAGSSATVGYMDLSTLSRSLEHALERSRACGHGRPGESALFSDAADEIRRLLHQFAAGFLRPVDAALIARLAEHELLPVDHADAVSAEETSGFGELAPSLAQHSEAEALAEDDIDAADAIDHELFPIFEEEAEELLPQLQGRLREWHEHPSNPGAPAACMRTLHTFKGGARLAGAMRLGEMAHRLESEIERICAQDEVQAGEVTPLQLRGDAMAAAFEALRRRGAGAPQPLAPAPVNQGEESPAQAPVPVPAPLPTAASEPVLQALLEPLQPLQVFTEDEVQEEIDIAVEPAEAAAPGAPSATIDWSRFSTGVAGAADTVAADKPAGGGAPAVRVRASLLDRLVNNAGEVSITRSRIDSSVRLMQGSMGELTDSLDRLRRQLRDIELQAETQISSRLEAAKASSMVFDPLEMDRFTRFQELTRFMVESVNDVATLQRSLQRTLQSAEDELAAQTRLTRELQDDLLRTRMVEFESMADRLYRTVRQAAKETAKQVRLDLVGGGIEIDRGVLERMAGSFEHLLRNCVAHGVESPAERESAGKDATGTITVTVAQSGNEVAVEFADDGAGLDLRRIRERALSRGLLDAAAAAAASDADLAQLIFAPGFSTAETVTELAGRGVGLDVVRAEVNAMGGRVETTSEPGKGTRFRLLLPLTTAVTQVVMLRCGLIHVAVPSPLIEVVRRVPTAEIEVAYERELLSVGDTDLPFFWLASMLDAGTRGPSTGRTQMVVVVRSAAQRVVVHVDEVVGNQEVVVKNVGPQLSRLPGLAGVTLLPSGSVALIYNPVALAAVYAEAAHARAAHGVTSAAPVLPQSPAPLPEVKVATVLVVDDSLTVRRVTQRLLVREGYRVITAKDGLEALERLAEERPAVLLSDIEMPRMDGFDLLRNVRSDPRLQGLPVVMITSRIAQKHRDYATELGVDHYLGKPYSEEELLMLVAKYVEAQKSH